MGFRSFGLIIKHKGAIHMKRLLAVILALALVFSFAGCVNSKGDESHDKMLIGTWVSKKTDSPQAAGWTLEFNEDGTLVIYVSDEQAEEFAEKVIGENIEQLGSLDRVLEESGFETKEELKAMYIEAAMQEFQRKDSYWKTQDNVLKRYNTKQDYDRDAENKLAVNTYEISEDGKSLTLYNDETVLGEYVKA